MRNELEVLATVVAATGAMTVGVAAENDLTAREVRGHPRLFRSRTSRRLG